MNTMANWHVAQLNIAQLLAPVDSPQLADFAANLDRINALADGAPGFVWRPKNETDSENESDQPFGDDLIVNLSVWESIESLHDYVYRTAHAQIMSRRKEWFARMDSAPSVLWWVPAGHRPDLVEASLRLEQLQKHGPGPDAFTFKHRMPMPD